MPPHLERVWKLIAEGYSNLAIAESIGVGRTTLKNYIKEIYGELGLTTSDKMSNSRVRAATLWYKRLQTP